ncbi:hypothetical protein SAMN06272722_105343 [Paenibacillus sp. RU5A]|nr:hypothetical protein SAMN06272722_105343 [Paenibacillus sp. RU5A]SOC71138.1 hypothetical protein SAMN05880581_105341 [Paenibacillus sp. RU26A]SOC73640.1 hypothetical protein SAMN05880586_105342 [Paenibacillus sp. RU5M]
MDACLLFEFKDFLVRRLSYGSANIKNSYNPRATQCYFKT